MASKSISRSGDPLNTLLDVTCWQKQEILRIESLSASEVLSELQEIMSGHSYSWHSINQLLQEQLEEGRLEFTFIDGDILFEWNNLCDERRLWEREGRLSQNCAEFNEDCLINLKILPFQAQLGHKGIQLVTTNVGRPNLSAANLWVVFDEREPELLTDNGYSSDNDDDYLSWVEESEDSDEDRYLEDSFEGGSDEDDEMDREELEDGMEFNEE